MKKVVLIPDSFKGTISSQEVCEIVARQVLRFHPEAEVISIPVADWIVFFFPSLGSG